MINECGRRPKRRRDEPMSRPSQRDDKTRNFPQSASRKPEDWADVNRLRFDRAVSIRAEQTSAIAAREIRHVGKRVGRCGA
jgi:hypothetical protein